MADPPKPRSVETVALAALRALGRASSWAGIEPWRRRDGRPVARAAEPDRAAMATGGREWLRMMRRSAGVAQGCGEGHSRSANGADRRSRGRTPRDFWSAPAVGGKPRRGAEAESSAVAAARTCHRKALKRRDSAMEMTARDHWPAGPSKAATEYFSCGWRAGRAESDQRGRGEGGTSAPASVARKCRRKALKNLNSAMEFSVRGLLLATRSKAGKTGAGQARPLQWPANVIATH